MVKLTDINLTIVPGTTIYLDIDIFRFIKDGDFFDVRVEIENNGEHEFLQDIDLSESEGIVMDHHDLERVALNWIFKNVEVVKEV